MEDYTELKALALKSAADFLRLYEAIPDKDERMVRYQLEKMTSIHHFFRSIS